MESLKWNNPLSSLSHFENFLDLALHSLISVMGLRLCASILVGLHLYTVATIGEEGTPRYIGPKLILFSGATAEFDSFWDSFIGRKCWNIKFLNGGFGVIGFALQLGL
ncbi:hypothetical protein QN277_018578 [Acacia crassicarpa]|uniref:Uncharacterized protein n=1 Tax=Acacia crassicarpa TaxID=499986 RepID=A0AAE1JW60_9FABA|nr:hypothetical protein QN277_018578 [Acacia crassicarpa]